MSENRDLPAIELPLTASQATRLKWAALVLGAASIVSGGLAAIGVFGADWTRIFAGLGSMLYALSYYFARQAPSSKSTAAMSGGETSKGPNE